MQTTLIGCAAVALFAALGYRRGVLSMGAVLFSLLVSGVLAEPLVPTARPFVESIPWIPLTLKPIAVRVVPALGVLVISWLLTSWLLRRRERRRLAGNLPAFERWERVGGLLVGGTWGLCLLVLVLFGLRLLGSVEEAVARASVPASASGAAAPPAGRFQEIRRQIDASVFKPLVEKADPVENVVTTTLADLARVAGNPALLERFQRHPVIARFIRDPRILSLSQDKEIARLVEERQYYPLLDHAKIAATLQDQALVAELKKADIRGILREVAGSGR